MKKFIVTPQYFAGEFMGYVFNVMMTPALEQGLKDLNVFSLEETEENKELLMALTTPKMEEWLQHEKEVQYFKEVVSNNPDLREVDGDVYFKDINVALPANLVEVFKEGAPTNIVNFWYWLSQVPNVSAREEMYDYIGREKLTILESGMLLCGRRIVKIKGEDDELLLYAQSTFNKLRSQKKSTNVEVFKNDEGYNLVMGNPCGNLKELAKRGNEIKFTDAHSGKMDYRLMVENRMPREECDHSGGYGPSFYNGGP